MQYKELKLDRDTLFLVTGGAGFIGSNLCEAVLDMGCRVRCLDNLSTGKRENVDMFLGGPGEGLAAGTGNDDYAAHAGGTGSDEAAGCLIETGCAGRYEFMQGDVRDFDTCMKACEGVDYVMHEAAWGSVPRSIEMPLFYCANNIQGTVNMMEASVKQGVKTFVYASSSSVYGDEPGLPKKEGLEGNLLSPYALTKMCDEEWAKQYSMHYGLKTVGLRYFNVFGRRQDPDGAYAAVIPKFIKLLLAGKRPTINGDGQQSRDFTYVENVIEANIKACLAPDEASGEAYNIAFGGREYLNDMYFGLTRALGVDIEPIYGPERAGDIKHSNADISKAKAMLGYDPQWSFNRGIEEAIEWYRENL